ncbi:hypothetical protein [Pseudoalteromonas ostreae]|uniref:hypothetical protein n=1 Tax=Pseudoalteromonas ostreae TaxID=2774154 RepID=UPI001B366E35|nr:hypothetical protein [Pseudoalteromonas ostreae]
MQDSVKELHETLDALIEAVESSNYELAKEKDLAFKSQFDSIIKNLSDDIENEQLASIFNDYSKVIENIELKKKDTNKEIVEFNTNQKKLQKYKHG